MKTKVPGQYLYRIDEKSFILINRQKSHFWVWRVQYAGKSQSGSVDSLWRAKEDSLKALSMFHVETYQRIVKEMQ